MLGPFAQWRRLDLSVVDSTANNATITADHTSEHILGSPFFDATLYFVAPPETSVAPGNHFEWEAELTPESGLEAMAPSEVLAALGNPYVPSPTLVSPATGEAILVGAYGIAGDELRMELPHDSLIAADVRAIVGDTLHLGRVDSGSTYRFYLRSSKPLVSGLNLYPNNSSGGERTGNGDVLLGSLDFEDGTDLDFGDAGVLFEIIPDRVGGIPGPVLVEASRTEASLGDTVTFHVRGRADDGTLVEYPDTMRFSVSLVRGASYGTLVSQEGDEEGDELYWTLNGFTLVVADTMTLEEIEIGVRASPNISVPARPALSHDGKTQFVRTEKAANHIGALSRTPVVRLGGSDIKEKGGIRRASIQDEPIGGLGFASVMVENHTILLGETKYYRAESDPSGELVIKGYSSVPAEGTLTNVDWVVTAVEGKRLGVYYEDRDSTGTVLSGTDRIRVIGRYWTPDTTYRVCLKATQGGRSDSTLISVKRPSSLGTTFHYAYHVHGADLINFDSLMILYAGSSGIPPQQLKGQVDVESQKDSGVFWPSYRYEPFRDWAFRVQFKIEYAEDYMSHPFWVDDNGMDPNDVPTNHSNIRPVYYRQTHVKIDDYIVNNLSQYLSGSGEGRNVIGSDIYTNMYKSMFRYYRNQLKLSPGSARDSADAWIKGRFKSDYGCLWAQTRKASSYGFFQMLYTTAIREGYLESYSNIPEALSDHDALFPRVKHRLVRYLNRVLHDHNPQQSFEDPDWTIGFERSWLESYRGYNDRDNYARDVMNSALLFPPISQ